jgi:hypothetical protein
MSASAYKNRNNLVRLWIASAHLVECLMSQCQGAHSVREVYNRVSTNELRNAGGTPSLIKEQREKATLVRRQMQAAECMVRDCNGALKETLALLKTELELDISMRAKGTSAGIERMVRVVDRVLRAKPGTRIPDTVLSELRGLFYFNPKMINAVL